MPQDEAYRQNSNICHTLVVNKMFDQSDVAGGRRRCFNNIIILDLTPGFNWIGLGKDNLQDETRNI